MVRAPPTISSGTWHLPWGGIKFLQIFPRKLKSFTLIPVHWNLTRFFYYLIWEKGTRKNSHHMPKILPFFSDETCRIWRFCIITCSFTAWKVSKYGFIFYGENLHIQCEYRKIRTRNNSVFAHFSRSVSQSRWITILSPSKNSSEISLSATWTLQQMFTWQNRYQHCFHHRYYYRRCYQEIHTSEMSL